MATRVSVVWKPRMNTQWNTIGMVRSSAIRPDQRWMRATVFPESGITGLSFP